MAAPLTRIITDPSLAPLVQSGQLQDVRDLLGDRMTKTPRDAVAMALTALIELELGNAESAETFADRAMLLAPENVTVQIARGYVLLAQKNIGEAEVSFAKALELDGTNVPAVLGLGDVNHRQRRFDRAIALFKKALEKHPDNAEINNQLGRAHNNKGELSMARQAFEKALATQPNFPEAHHNLGHIARRMGDLDGAARHFKKAIGLQADYVSAHYNLGTVYLAKDQFARAESSFRNLLELQAAHPAALCNLGVCLIYGDKLSEAIQVLHQSTDLEPRSAEAWTSLGLALTKGGHTQQGIDAYRKSHALNPSDPGLISQFAATLAKHDEHDEAAVIAENLLAEKPAQLPANQADDFLRLGNAMRFAGRLDLAIECYRRCLQANPAAGQGYLYLAAALVESGNTQQALETIEKSLQLQPGYQSALALKITILQKLDRYDEARELLDLEKFVQISDLDTPRGYATVEEFNQKLVRRVMAEPSLEFERTGHATRKGRHTDALDIEGDGPYRDFASQVDQACVRFMDRLEWREGHPLLGRRPSRWRLQMWSVVMDSQGYQIPHTHDDGYLSGVYYPQLPAVIDDPVNDEQGWLEFGRPAEELIGDTTLLSRRIQPKAGRLVIFPSYFVHRTIPFESDEARISIAFDLRPVD